VFRVLLYSGLLYLGFRKLKAMGYWPGGKPDASGPSDADVSDVLIQDPVCGTYVSKRGSIRLTRGDATYHFCSDACRNRFISGQKTDA